MTHTNPRRPEMGTLLAAVLYAMKNLEELAATPGNDILIALSTGGTRAEWAALALRQSIRNLQKQGSFAAAGGYMPWLHTLRAYNYPELRGTAREMWDHLRRGEPRLDAELTSASPDELRPYLEWAIG